LYYAREPSGTREAGCVALLSESEQALKWEIMLAESSNALTSM